MLRALYAPGELLVLDVLSISDNMCFVSVCFKSENCGPPQCTCTRQTGGPSCLESELICAIIV